MWSPKWRQLLKWTSRANNIMLCPQLGKTQLFSLYVYHPSNQISHDPEISVNNNELISAVLSYPIFRIGTRLGRAPQDLLLNRNITIACPGRFVLVINMSSHFVFNSSLRIPTKSRSEPFSIVLRLTSQP